MEPKTVDDVHVEAVHGPHIVPIEQEATEDVKHVNLTWRSWVVVFCCCFAVMSQVFVVAAAGSVLAFIIRELGEPAIANWVIQGPLLMQSVLSPLVGRLSDVLDRKLFSTIPPLIACVGAVVCAKATSMSMLIGGGILIGVTLATISIVQAIPSEILPLKYRAVANGFAGVAGVLGGTVGSLGAGAVTNISPTGWRYIFWIQVGLHGFSSLGLLLFYWPKKRTDYPKMSLKEIAWACDPIGSFLLVSSATLMLLALNWAGGAYKWSNPHIYATLVVGIVLFIAFCLYEWKGRTDGIVAHVFFSTGPNFWLSTFAFAIEGWIYYSAVNSVTPQLILNLGFEDNSWDIAVRQLAYKIASIFTSIAVTWWATRFKDLKTPLVVTFGIMFIAGVCFAVIRPSWSTPQIVFTALTGIGCAGPLTLLIACVQFTAPHAFLSTATGLAFSARAIGGAFGTACIYGIVNSHIASHYASDVGSAAIAAGLPASSVGALLKAMKGSTRTKAKGQGVPGATQGIMDAAWSASYWSYARAYRLGFWSVVPFVALATVSVACMKGVRELMTERVEATVERESDEETERTEKA
ncbi:MFS general substrate transporter [Westerdykella ornata]|uniref:MFS general substrate transporter n=1 Tax=Westerdykella ornata TaxID=318751 RepID=A0A6A6JVP1_WESOR|nr:MFS general substrate transporter [Westerdykella ornata]KAF2279816.1 MFS general substrate transporter [Westerdykella ornata]